MLVVAVGCGYMEDGNTPASVHVLKWRNLVLDE